MMMTWIEKEESEDYGVWRESDGVGEDDGDGGGEVNEEREMCWWWW